MKRFLQLNVTMLISMTVLSLVFTGCSKDDDNDPGYTSFGDWPEYAGNWRSESQLVGSEVADNCYLSISIQENGLFEGDYQSYTQTGTITIPVGIINVTYPVYDPNGNKKSVKGAIDFDSAYGIATFDGIGEMEFSIYAGSSNTGFSIGFYTSIPYDGAYIE